MEWSWIDVLGWLCIAPAMVVIWTAVYGWAQNFMPEKKKKTRDFKDVSKKEPRDLMHNMFVNMNIDRARVWIEDEEYEYYCFDEHEYQFYQLQTTPRNWYVI